MSARPEWYDRNASQAGIAYGATNVAPHVITSRASYTVPSGKKAFITAVQLDVRRRVAATTLGTVLARLNLAGGTGFVALHENNTVDSRRSIETSIGSILLAGQTIELQTQDISTGGAMDYTLSVVIVEFSA